MKKRQFFNSCILILVFNMFFLPSLVIAGDTTWTYNEETKACECTNCPSPPKDIKLLSDDRNLYTNEEIGDCYHFSGGLHKYKSHQGLSLRNSFFTSITDSSFDHINLSGSLFYIDIENSSFENANLSGSNFIIAYLRNSNFNQADFRNSNFDSAYFSKGTTLIGSIFSTHDKPLIFKQPISEYGRNKLTFTGVDLSSSRFESANLTLEANSDALSVDFEEGTILNQASFKKAIIGNKVVFDNVVAKNSYFQEATISGIFKNSDFQNANFADVIFGKEHKSKTIIIDNPIFENVNLQGVDFRGAQFFHPNPFKRCNLQGAIFNDATKLPVLWEIDKNENIYEDIMFVEQCYSNEKHCLIKLAIKQGMIYEHCSNSDDKCIQVLDIPTYERLFENNPTQSSSVTTRDNPRVGPLRKFFRRRNSSNSSSSPQQ